MAEFRLYTADGVAPNVAGFYHPGRNGGDLVIGNSGQGFSSSVLHEYTHHFLHSAKPTIPLWYDEGFAELIAHQGDPIPARVAELRRGPMVSLAALASVDHTSPEYHEPNKIDMFYSESWALVHMLHTSSAYAPELPRILDLLFAGIPASDAFDRVYQKTGIQVQAELTSYVARELWPTSALELRKIAPVNISRARLLTRVESGVLLAELLIDLGRTERAGRALRKLARSNPGAPAIEVALGDVELASDRRPLAVARYRRAIEHGSKDVQAYVQLASLMDDDAAIPVLEKAVALDPDCRDARELLRSIRERKQPPVTAARLPHSAPDVLTPKSWENPHGDAHVAGKLVQLDCAASPVILHVVAGGRQLVLSISDPHKIVIRNAPGQSTELRCGEMDRQAAIEYTAATGEITAIELR